jgi:hypothetical protein
MDKIIVDAIVAAVAAIAAAYASAKISLNTVASNRAVEFPNNEKSEPLSSTARDWTAVHIRDDLGSIHNLIVLTNALLAGILAVLLVR